MNGRNTRQTRRRRKRKRTAKNYIAIIIAAVLIILAVFAVYKGIGAAYNIGKGYVTGENTNSTETALGEEVEFTIPAGASTKDIAEILHSKGLISSKLFFRINSKLDGYDGTYMQGTYKIPLGTSEEDIMKTLQSGLVYNDSIKITIPEGYTAMQIAKTTEESGICTADEFIEEMNTGTFDFDFISSLPDRQYRLEGYLFPDTYFISETGGAHELIEKMLTRFDDIYNENIKSYVEKSDYTMDEIITIASIIESEIKADSERTIASAVIYNRLNSGMKLQMDATVQYAQGLRKEVVTSDDLSIDSPYNTYKVDGLPLGPISNPGKSSLIAAVTPDDNNYLYYVLKDRTSGEHFYTNDYNEFLKAKEQYKSQF